MTGRIFLFLHAAVFFIAGLFIFFFGHGWVRGYLGDVAAIGFLHFFLRAIFLFHPKRSAIAVFCFAILIECLQYVGAIRAGGLFQRAIVGNTFDLLDVAIYGFVAIGVMLYDMHLTKIPFWCILNQCKDTKTRSSFWE